MKGDVLIKIEDLSLVLDGNRVLDGLSLSVREGEYLSVIGPNGAGKTTLLKCVARLYCGWTGAIRLGERPLESWRARELARMLGYVPQAEGRTFPFTVREFVTLGRYPHLSPFTSVRGEDRAAIDGALSAAGLDALHERPMDRLSGGERQMAFIAAALAQGARILLLDEPTTFLDYRHQADVMTLLRRLNRESGLTVVSVNHNLNTAACSDRIAAIKGGRIRHYDTPAGILRREVLEDIYDTPFRLIPNPTQSIPLAVAEGTL